MENTKEPKIYDTMIVVNNLKQQVSELKEENKRLTEALESSSIALAELHQESIDSVAKQRYEALFHKDIFELHKLINIEAEKGGRLVSMTNNINGTIAFMEYGK